MVELTHEVLTKQDYETHPMRILLNESGITARTLKNTLAEFSMHAVNHLPSAAQNYTEAAEENRKESREESFIRSVSRSFSDKKKEQQITVNSNVDAFMGRHRTPLNVSENEVEHDDIILPVETP